MKHLSMLLGLLLATACNSLMAQEVSVDEAKSRALDFLTNNTPAAKRAKGNNMPLSLSLAYTSRSENKTCFYVFNVGEDKGFVIAGGDEAAREILGYCDHGKFDYDSAPENFKWWLGEYTNQIAHAELSAEAGSSSSYSAPRRAKAEDQRESIGPLIKTKWNQGYPYNSEIPVYSSDGQPYMTGCVATAMAQVMKYWEHPVQGVGSHEYKWNGNTFSANFGETTYDWGNMLDRYRSGTYNETEAKAVGTLMHHAGVAVEMKYGTGSSGAAFPGRIRESLIKNFKYDPAVLSIERIYFFTDELWEDLIYDELNEGRPVLYAGTNVDGSGSHAFICDGYDSETGLFSFNWGWTGSEDGFYTLSGVNAVNFWSYAQNIIINVQPKDLGTNPIKHHLYVNDYSLQSIISAKDFIQIQNGDFTFDRQSAQDASYFISLSNLCVENRRSYYDQFDLGVKAVETTTGNVYYWTCLPNEWIPLNTFSYKTLEIPTYDLPADGTYELYPVFRSSVGTVEDWCEMQPRTTKTDIPTLTIIGGENTEPVDIPFTINGVCMEKEAFLVISHSCNYLGNVTYSSSNPAIATVDADGIITGVSAGEVTITASGEAEGTYKKTTTSFDITVVDKIKEELVIGISKNIMKISQTCQLSWPDDFDGAISFESSDEKVATVDEGGLITAIDVGEVIITANATGSTLYNDKEFQFEITIFNHDLIFTEQPYFNNDNNPYDGDPYLWCYEMNIGETVNSSLIIMPPTLGGPSSDPRTRTSMTKNIPSGGSDKQGLNILTGLEVDSVYTFYIYHDYECTQPWNYPSVTFTLRSRLDVDYSVGSTGYGTLILPFNQELPAGMKVYGCTGVDDNGVLTLVEDNSIRRNVPYIVKATPGSAYQFVGPKAIDDDKPSFTNGILVGAVAETVPLVAGTDYIMQEQNGRVAFHKYTGTPSADPSENDNEGNRLAKPFRTFLRLNDSTLAMLYLPDQIGDEGEGIEVIGNDNARPAGIYSIDGKRHINLQKGLNVIVQDDGTTRKVYVK